jgi:hypothetical protein
MFEILTLTGEDAALSGAADAVRVLEAGGLVVLPERAFEVAAGERDLIDPAIGDGKAKNVSLDPATGALRGSSLQGARRDAAQAMIARFAEAATALIGELAPAYVPALQRRRTSFRPGAVATRALSRRKDDRRLHVDAFPSNPTHGRRILRVFANVDPSGAARVWEVGEDGFLTARGRTAGLKTALGITRGRQSAYDQVMLQLHDAAKLDDAYQAATARRRVAFAAGGMWAVYTDSVMHAALAGQHAFEQTWLMPVEAMAEPSLAPVRVLERTLGRALVGG